MTTRPIIDGPHARYTVQFIIAGYAMPQGDDVQHFTSKGQVLNALKREHEAAERVGAGYSPSEALIWIGHHDDVTDVYPDFTATMGPRGGASISLV